MKWLPRDTLSHRETHSMLHSICLKSSPAMEPFACSYPQYHLKLGFMCLYQCMYVDFLSQTCMLMLYLEQAHTSNAQSPCCIQAAGGRSPPAVAVLCSGLWLLPPALSATAVLISEGQSPLLVRSAVADKAGVSNSTAQQRWGLPYADEQCCC